MQDEALKQMLVDHPHTDNAEIDPAIKAGLTRDDVEWNQRLDRPWTYHPTDKDEEVNARIEWYTRNGVDAATAKENVAARR